MSSQAPSSPTVSGSSQAPSSPAAPGSSQARGTPAAPGRPSRGLSHPLRAALLDLLSRRPTLTSTEAARELGESSGACSFHLRQLERYGLIEAAPGQHGRARPWRLVTGRPEPPGDEFGELARELENEGYRRWLAGRDTAPPGWHDEAFSTVLHLTPAELTELADAIRSVIAQYADRDPSHSDPSDRGHSGPEPGRPEPGRPEPGRPRHHAAEPLPVGVVARLFPLLPPHT